MPEVFMPRLSDTMEEGAISSWGKQVGDAVHKGDVLAEIETDKAVMELEAYDEGILTEILVEAGSSAPIGAPIAVIGQRETVPDQEAAAEPPAPTPTPTPTPRETTRPESQSPTGPSTSAMPPATATAPATPPLASPLARSLAKKHGLNIGDIHGTGPGGRILRADVEAAAAQQAPAVTSTAAAPPAEVQPPAPPTPTPAEPETATGRPVSADDEEVPLSRVRRLTAQRLAQSAQQAPHFHLTRTVDADALLAFRKQANADLDGTGVRISVTDLLVKACAHSLSQHPEVNCSWAETKLLRHRRINIGLAVAVDDGLVVPVIHDADHKTLADISREAHDLAEHARAGKLSLDEITGGTFTISNLGMYGIDRFTAVINPPDAAILAVGAARPAPVARDGHLAVATTMDLTLGIDHRVLDGATAARFLADLAALLERPSRIVL